MTTLKEQILSDLDIIFNTDEFADNATYTSKDGTIISKAIKIIVDFGADLSRTEYGSADFVQIRVKKSDIPNPSVYDTLILNGITYTVRQRLNGDNYIWNLITEADQRQNPRG